VVGNRADVTLVVNGDYEYWAYCSATMSVGTRPWRGTGPLSAGNIQATSDGA